MPANKTSKFLAARDAADEIAYSLPRALEEAMEGDRFGLQRKLIEEHVPLLQDAIREVHGVLEQLAEDEMKDQCDDRDEHWIEDDTDEIRTGSGEDVEECQCGVAVQTLMQLGYVNVQRLTRCTECDYYGGHHDTCTKAEPAAAE